MPFNNFYRERMAQIPEVVCIHMDCEEEGSLFPHIFMTDKVSDQFEPMFLTHSDVTIFAQKRTPELEKLVAMCQKECGTLMVIVWNSGKDAYVWERLNGNGKVLQGCRK